MFWGDVSHFIPPKRRKLGRNTAPQPKNRVLGGKMRPLHLKQAHLVVKCGILAQKWGSFGASHGPAPQKVPFQILPPLPAPEKLSVLGLLHLVSPQKRPREGGCWVFWADDNRMLAEKRSWLLSPCDFPNTWCTAGKKKGGKRGGEQTDGRVSIPPPPGRAGMC